MIVLIIILGIIAVIANFIMDELDFHYDRFFGKLIKSPSGIQWWNPAISWMNKYVESKILTFLLSTVLVFATDAWHLFKTLFLTCIALIILLLENDTLKWWQYGVELLVVGLLWGFIWELTNGVIGAISDKLK